MATGSSSPLNLSRVDALASTAQHRVPKPCRKRPIIEACLTKLHYLFSQNLEVETIRHLMQDNLRGELTR